MHQSTTIVGLDVHKETIVAAVLSPGAERVMERATIANRPPAVERLVGRVSATGPVTFVYEAGPCGYEVERQIRALGQEAVVVAPGLTPRSWRGCTGQVNSPRSAYPRAKRRQRAICSVPARISSAIGCGPVIA